MTIAAEATINEPLLLADNAPVVLCTVPRHSASLPRLPIRTFFPITTDRALDERLTARRAITLRGIYYSYTFLTSPTTESRSNSTPLRTYSSPSRLERALSMTSSPSPLPQTSITISSTQSLSAVCDTQSSSSSSSAAAAASVSQEGQSDIEKRISHFEEPESREYPLQVNDNHCVDCKNPIDPQSQHNEVRLPQDNSELLTDGGKHILQFQEDNNEADPHQNSNKPYDSCPLDISNPVYDTNETQARLKEHTGNFLVAGPTVNLSTPPSRPSLSSRLPVRTSKSMPTQYPLNDNSASTKATNLPTDVIIKTPPSPRRKTIHSDFHTSNTPSSPRPSAASTGKPMASHRLASKVPIMTTPRVAKAREADVPMARRMMNTSTSSGAGRDAKSLKEDKVDEDEEAAPARLTPQEKRRREAMRAQQIKLWRVREEREAREARTVARRRLMERRREPSPPPPAPRRAVKFNLKRNKIIEISQQETQ
ncbi:hypothetical protein BX666DRAFT_1436587 [Dichotomocladium elegans]|nr:hypothetical protein BX666DRAFT_1436587 [Dichotomocladium elegans]